MPLSPQDTRDALAETALRAASQVILARKLRQPIGYPIDRLRLALADLAKFEQAHPETTTHFRLTRRSTPA